MGIHVPESIAKLAKNNQVKVDIDLTMLSKIQVNKVLRMAKTGIINGDGITALLAKSIRKINELPTAGFSGNGVFKWWGVPPDSPLFPALRAAIVATKMVVKEGFNEFPHLAAFTVEVGHAHHTGCGYGLEKAVSKAIDAVDLGCNEAVMAVIEGIKSGRIRTQELIYS